MRTERKTRCGFQHGIARCAAALVFCILIYNTAYSEGPAERAAPQRFKLSGRATLKPDPPILRGDRLRLTATLSPAAIPTDAPVLQSDGRFALRAALGSASLVCYADTIFRDDFDGDGF